jgi:hypothetical protein
MHLTPEQIEVRQWLYRTCPMLRPSLLDLPMDLTVRQFNEIMLLLLSLSEDGRKAAIQAILETESSAGPAKPTTDTSAT